MKLHLSYTKIDEDWGETKDLSKSQPKKLIEMMNEWKIFKNKVGIIPLDKGERIHLDIN